ncbi:MAG: ATP-binding protein [Clostridia bacterium]
MDLFEMANSEEYEIQQNVLEGFRLHKVEVYNWGTFDKEVWTVNLDGNTSLLTGDVGSGKSTIIDALVTLLISPRKTSYNKAADADSKERSLKTYTLGYYGNEKAYEGKSKPRMHRQHNSYSVILATFKDEFIDKTVTLAQVFYFKDKTSSPRRIYVVSSKELFVKEHFAKFDGDIKNLRARLKEQNISMYDSYENYSEMFRPKLGKINNQALDLFVKTISMKKVEALTDFVRTSMLEPTDIETKIFDLITRYQDLSDSYEKVVIDTDQIALLTPLREDNEKLIVRNKIREEISLAVDNLQSWFAQKNKKMYEQEISKEKLAKNRLEISFEAESKMLESIEQDIENIKIEIYGNGGELLQKLKSNLESYKKSLKNCKEQFTKYHADAKLLELNNADSSEKFNENIEKMNLINEQNEHLKVQIEESMRQVTLDTNNFTTKKDEIKQEITSLKQRTSNISSKSINLRNKICQELGVDALQLPFIGELIEVKESESEWEGAIERLLHNFAMSLAVPKNLYNQVSSYINANHLNVKIVYYAVDIAQKRQFDDNINSNSVINKLDIKSDSIFKNWIDFEIKRRFNFICCEEIELFRRYDYAITKSGQIKSKMRHEKDDRKFINDKTTYILGFSNKRKIELYEIELEKYKLELIYLENKEKEYRAQLSDVQTKHDSIIRLQNFDNFAVLDVNSAENNIEKTKTQIQEIEKTNDVLKKLQEDLVVANEMHKVQKNNVSKISNEKIRISDRIESLEKDESANSTKINVNADMNAFEYLDRNLKKAVKALEITLKNTMQVQFEYSDFLNKVKEDEQSKISSLEKEIIRKMGNFIKKYPIQGREMDDSIESMPEFMTLLETKERDDLPTHKNKFKEDLQSNVIRYIGTFGHALHSSAYRIRSKIDKINESLRTIDYNDGRYIKLEVDDSQDILIKEFRVELRQCTQDTAAGLDDIDIATEKFLQIQKIIDRFKGREGHIDYDKKWTQKVTDVRNWFNFSASECSCETNEIYEYYTDSGGKSGGQKEKLAYTILAASLTYNYGLTNKTERESTFRFVTIDEAFLKSSDEYAEYGLKLFKNLGFQLLIVTPLLKVNTIEPYISNVCYVNLDKDSNLSSLKNMKIEEYKRRHK